MKVYQVFKCDRRLNKESEVLCGTFTTKMYAARAVSRFHELEEVEVLGYNQCIKLTKKQRLESVTKVLKHMLIEQGETQGFPVNYIIKEIELNVWLDKQRST